MGAVIGGVADGRGDARYRAAAAAAEHLERHDLRLVGHARHAHAVVGGLGDGAGHVGAVRVVIQPVRDALVHEGLAVHELDAREIWDRAHLDALVVEILVGDARIDHRHDHVFSARHRPGLGHADRLEVPLQRVHGIVRREPRFVWLRRGDGPGEVDSGDRVGGKVVEQLGLGALHERVAVEARAQRRELVKRALDEIEVVGLGVRRGE